MTPERKRHPARGGADRTWQGNQHSEYPTAGCGATAVKHTREFLQADAMFHAHQALLNHLLKHPELRGNGFYQLIRADAYEAFRDAFNRV